MAERVKYFLSAGVAVLLAVFITAASYSKAVYISDYIRSMAIRIFNLYGSSGGGVSLISGDKYRAYVKTYAELPAGYFHFGSTLLYRAPKNIRLPELLLNSIEYTEFYKLHDYRKAFLNFNRVTGNIVNRGEIVVISTPLHYFSNDVFAGRTPEIKFTRGLYFSGDRAGSPSFLSRLPYFKSIGINSIVFDVKDITGIVHLKNSRVREVKELGLNRDGAIDNLPMLVRQCRKNGIYMIARISVFRDHLLYEMDPSSRIRSGRTGRGWNHGTKELWCDPTNKKVQDYNIALAAELAASGVDEIQFDYIRFPTAGDQDDAIFAWPDGKRSRVDEITGFLKRAHREVASYDAFLSIDIFGVTAWGKDVDIQKLGQQIELLAANCDIISPMLYPSHFNDHFDGFAKPGDHPYHFIFSGCKKVIELAGKKALVRPWLQAFSWRVSRYNAEYILEQVKAANDSGAYGYLFWNASNKYDEVFRAMEELR
ncbi:MAG TPA: putative glycoside hydrolase [Spirochaetota bacterium]|nr:putative glycoside hydrolase [Spirochaetota bacterium]HPR38749.1 putative glycoside hydrolase [Spirochaetota bacterium]